MSYRSLFRAGLGLALAGLVAGCGWFSEDEEKLSGERIRIREGRTAAANAVTGRATPLPAPRENSDWTQTNSNAAHYGGHIAGPSAPKLVWTADAGAGGVITSAPVVTGGRIYTLDAESQVTAFDAGTGSRIWRAGLAPKGEDGDEGFGGGLAALGDRIFATTGFGEILALSAATGEIIWRYKAKAPFRAAPAAARGIVIAVTRDNEALGVAAADGALRWRIAGVAAKAGLLGGASPAISGQLAVLPFASGEVMGVLATNGRQIWSAVLGAARRGHARGSIADVSGDPVIAGRAVVAANHSGRMVAIDGQTGRRGWTRSIGTSGSIWAAAQSVFVVSDVGEVLRIDGGTGRTVWRTEMPAYEDPDDRDDPIAYSGPVLAGGRLYVTDSIGNLWSFDPETGAKGEAIRLSDGSTTGPVVAGGTMYVLSKDATLQAFR